MVLVTDSDKHINQDILTEGEGFVQVTYSLR